MITPLLANDDVAIVIDTLPSTFRLIAALAAHLQKPDADLDETTVILQRDARLTTALIATANAEPYAAAEPLDRLDAVMTRLGQQELFRIAGAIAGREFAEPLAVYEVSAEQLDDCAVFTALVMEQLAVDSGVEPTAAYIVGLVSPLGKVVLNRMAKRTAAVTPFTGTVQPLAEWEEATLGYANTDIAAAVLEYWQFPAETVGAVRDHYAPPQDAPAMTRLLQIAADAAHARGHAFPGEAAYWQISPENLAAVGLDATRVNAATAKADRIFQRMHAAIAATPQLKSAHGSSANR